MKVYKSVLGMTCVEADEGHLLEKDGETFKKVFLGKNDRPEFYRQVVDKSYIKVDTTQEVAPKKEKLNTDGTILTSPNGKKYKLIVSDEGTLGVEEI